MTVYKQSGERLSRFLLGSRRGAFLKVRYIINSGSPIISTSTFDLSYAHYQMDQERLDIVIMGATGFTGKYVVREAERLAKEKNFTWGIAGRRKDALKSVLKEFAPNSDNIRVIIADLEDEVSLKKMAEQAKVVVNCCGPYRFYGEPVVKACVAAQSHHVDVSGEPQYMEKMQLEYDKAAREAKIYIVSACGFDCIPSDMGIIFTQKQFSGEINSIETYMTTWQPENYGGTSFNYATWESAVYGLAHAHELRELRSKLSRKKFPALEPKLLPKGSVHRSEISKGWSTVFPGSDRSVNLRTQRYLYENFNQRPVQIQTYWTFKSLWSIVLGSMVGSVLSMMTKSERGRSLLLKYPKIFSGGVISHQSPNPKAIENTRFSVTIVAKGWTEKSMIESKDPPNKLMVTRVTGINPGYGATCTTVLMSALMILRESQNIPDCGGVLTPGAAFANTTMIEELDRHGVKFEVVGFVVDSDPEKQYKVLSKL